MKLLVIFSFFSGDHSTMTTNLDSYNVEIEEHENFTIGKISDFLEALIFKTNKRGNIGKRDKMSRDYLWNPIRYELNGKYRTNTESIEDLTSMVKLEEEEKNEK